jgi:hypothetical protein
LEIAQVDGFPPVAFDQGLYREFGEGVDSVSQARLNRANVTACTSHIMLLMQPLS